MEKKIKVHEKNTMLVWAQVSFYTFLWDEGAKRDNSLLNLKNTCNFSNQMFSYKDLRIQMHCAIFTHLDKLFKEKKRSFKSLILFFYCEGQIFFFLNYLYITVNTYIVFECLRSRPLDGKLATFSTVISIFG